MTQGNDSRSIPDRIVKRGHDYLFLGESKKRTLVHLMRCDEPVCNANHVASIEGYDQSTIDQAAKELATDHYLEMETWKGHTKKLMLTMKGAAAAVFHFSSCTGSHSGAYRNLRKYTKKHHPKSLDAFRALDDRMLDSEQKDYLVTTAMDYVLKNDCFDDQGKERISDHQKRELASIIGHAGVNRYGKVEVGSPEYFEKYRVTPTFTAKILDESENVIVDARERMKKQEHV